MSKFKQLKKDLEVVQLDERLEMVQLAATAVEEEGNGCCTGNDED